MCHWDDFDSQMVEVATQGTTGPDAPTPFPLLSLIDDPGLHRKAASLWGKANARLSNRLGSLDSQPLGSKIGVATLAGTSYQPATSHLVAELFELHHHDHFEITALSIGPERHAPMRQRFAASFDCFLDVRGQSGLEIARLGRQLGVEIAMDLHGYTQDSRTAIFAERYAPIQINWL
jgi:predicted O-linked N-acetylglucosamine transferase (SPINDLY family)